MAIGQSLDPSWPLANDPLPRKLTTLRLMNSTASTNTVEFLLRQTPNLQSLVCDFKNMRFAFLSLDQLNLALSHVRDTLTQLVIRFDPTISPSMNLILVGDTLVGTLGSK